MLQDDEYLTNVLVPQVQPAIDNGMLTAAEPQGPPVILADACDQDA